MNAKNRLRYGELGDISLAGDMDISGRVAMNGIFGDRMVATRDSDISLTFAYGNSINDLTTAVSANGGAITNAAAFLVASSSTAVGGTIEIESKNAIRYRAGHDGYAYFTALFSSPKVLSYQYIGAMSSTDGFFVGYYGTLFGVGHRDANTQNFISKFNLDPIDGTGKSGFKLDQTKLNIFRIQWGYLGIAPVFYEVWAGASRGWVAFHILDLANTQTHTHHELPYLPIRVEVGNTGNNTDIVLKTASWSGGTLGGSMDTHVGSRFFCAESTKTVTALVNILSIKVATTLNTKVNKIRVRLRNISYAATNGASNTSTIKLLKGVTLGGSPSFTAVSTGESTISVDTAGTTITGGVLQQSFNLGTDGADNHLWNGDAIYLYAGETLTVAATVSGGSSATSVSLKWEEEF